MDVNGQRDKLYAAPGLHEQLQAAGVRPGDVFTITKIEGEGNRKHWLIEPNGNGAADISNPANSPPYRDATPYVSPDTMPASTSQSANGHPPMDFPALDQLMTHYLRSAHNAWQSMDETVEVTSDDIRRTALSLFIECSRRGICPQSTETPDTVIPTEEAEESEDDLPF